MKKRYGRSVILLIAVLGAAVLGISGCGGSKSAVSTTAAEPSAAASAVAMETEIYGHEEKLEVAEDSYSTSDTSSEQGLVSQSGGLSPAVSNRKLIRNVNMQVETDTFDKLVNSVSAKITELGGYTEQSEISGTSLNYRGESSPRYASITARIPSNSIDSFVTAVENNGNVINKSETTSDVTLQYSDVESRKKSLEIEQDRIWALLEKADSLDTVITLEQRLSDIRYELESMGSQLRLLDNQVEYSTVYLSISEVTNFTPVEPESAGTRIKNGFSQNLIAMSTALTTLFIGLAVTSPFWLPLTAVTLIVLYIVHRRAKKQEQAEKETAEKEKREEKKDIDSSSNP